MTKNEANKIFNVWQTHIEIFDKLLKIFDVIPESFLPYRVDILEDALNIIAKDYFDNGDKKTASNIQETMMLHMGGLHLTTNYKKMTDEEAILKMQSDLDYMFNNENIKNLKLKLLRQSAESWTNIRDNN